ncbi:MAG TPA: hypothetical protein VGB30_07715 [bacterium]|jgi:hypothetical protein
MCKKYGYLAVVVALPFIVFLPALNVGFLCDDYGFSKVFNMSWSDMADYINLVQAGDERMQPFRPLAILTFKMDYLIYGLDPIGFHLSNLLLHSYNSILIWWLATLLGESRRGATIAALLFGVYPGFSEPVIWISGRFDLLSLTFLLFSIIFWIEGGKTLNGKYKIAATLLFLLGMFCKESIAPSAVIFPVIDLMIFGKRAEKAAWILPFVMVGIIVFIRIWVFGTFSGDLYLTRSSEPVYSIRMIPQYFSSMLQNITILFTPVNRRIFDPVSVVYVQIATSILAIGVVYVSLRSSIVKDKRLICFVAFAAGWLILMLIPTLTIMPAQDALTNSRFLYIPVVGIMICIGAVIDSFTNLKAGILLIGVACWIGMSTYLLICNNSRWYTAADLAWRVDAVLYDNTKNMTDCTTVIVVNMPYLRDGVFFAPNTYENFIEFRDGCHDIRFVYVRKDVSKIPGWAESLCESRMRCRIFHWTGNELRYLDGNA